MLAPAPSHPYDQGVTVTFPAFCPNCGLIFQSRLIGISGTAHNITLSGNREQCPRCNAWAELPDGTFDVVDETIHVLSASALTHTRLLRLQAILDQARSGDMTADAAAEAVTAEAPSLKPLFERFEPRMQRALIFFLATVIQVLLAQGIAELRDDSATKHDVQEAVERAITECQRQQP